VGVSQRLAPRSWLRRFRVSSVPARKRPCYDDHGGRMTRYFGTLPCFGASSCSGTLSKGKEQSCK
jgi:hypothetical protein